MELPSLTLASGSEIPMLGYGCGTVWMTESDDDINRDTVDAIKQAIELGYRHLDGAQYYRTEAELGLAVEESGISRSDFFITTKAVSPIDVEGALRLSLKRLRTEYVDLYLIHEPFSSGGRKEILQEAWKGMESCLRQGLARSIGVSNFLIPHIEAILETATIKPAVNQIELHPYLQRTELREFLKTQAIQVEAFAPLTPLTKASPGPIDKICRILADKYSVTSSAILLRWLIDQGVVVLTTSSQKTRLVQYLEHIPSFHLSGDEIAEISEAGQGKTHREFFVDGYGEDCFL
ncbi:hypothetical protein S40288_05510 [Stachybotrys chartarum IBT 40288]|nr:hypothetical protein S40288_05510 [Stachybotrys chartarum IBT 40288]